MKGKKGKGERDGRSRRTRRDLKRKINFRKAAIPFGNVEKLIPYESRQKNRAFHSKILN